MWLRELLILAICLLLGTACADAKLSVSTASPLPPLQFTPEVISAQLQPVPDVATAAAQFAAALEIPADQVQVRIRSKECTICNLAENGAESRPPLLTLAEAEATIAAYDLLWLTVQGFNCAYYFDGKTFSPRSCQMD